MMKAGGGLLRNAKKRKLWVVLLFNGLKRERDRETLRGGKLHPQEDQADEGMERRSQGVGERARGNIYE